MLPDLLGDLDPQQPLNGNSPFAAGLYGLWLPLPNRKAGATMYDLTANHHDGSMVSGPKWVGTTIPGAFAALAATGGSGFTLPFPALAATDSVTLIVHHLPITWTGGFTALFDDSGRQYSLFFDTSGNGSFAGAVFLQASGTAMTAGSPWQLTYTRQNVSPTTAGYFCYVNGVLKFSSSSAGSGSATASTLNFGPNPSGGGSAYNGQYGLVAFYKGRAFAAADAMGFYLETINGFPTLLNRRPRSKLFLLQTAAASRAPVPLIVGWSPKVSMYY